MRPPHRALRALAAVLMMWVGGRVVMLWPETVIKDLPRQVQWNASAPLTAQVPIVLAVLPSGRSLGGLPRATLPPSQRSTKVLDSVIAPVEVAGLTAEAGVPVQVPVLVQSGTDATPLPTQSNARKRISLAGWMLIRPEASSARLATAGQLGGSQIGARLGYPIANLSPTHIVAASARLSSGLERPYGREAAIGIGIKHRGRISGEVLIEHRFKLGEGGRTGLAMVAAAGAYDLPLAPKTSASVYAQGGVVGVTARDAFADGAARIDYEAAIIGKTRVTAGGGVWVAAQPGVSRVDIGPQIAVRPVFAKGGARISAEWRFRVAGNARPASGPALSAGFDF